MKIIQIAPVAIPVTPELKYGGIERVVLDLSRQFTAMGFEVVTAAPADSKPYGTLLPTLPVSEWGRFGKNEVRDDAYREHIDRTIDYLLKESADIIHDHTGNFVLTDTFRRRSESEKILQDIPIVVTPHEFKRFRKTEPPKRSNIYFTTLSEYQKRVFSGFVDVRRVINNGIFVKEYPFETQKEDYLFSLGSIEYDKGQDLAVRVAIETGLPLIIGGKIMEEGFFQASIAPYLSDKIRYIGELDDEQKKKWYKGAKAFLAPIRIGDCFSLTRIESLACGTPVITLDTGSASEAIEDGVTGYIVPYHNANEYEVVQGIKNAVSRINKISTRKCRLESEKRFNWPTMCEKYAAFYQEILKRK